MPEPLFTYDYHEQFLDAVSKYFGRSDIFTMQFLLNNLMLLSYSYFIYTQKPVAR